MSVEDLLILMFFIIFLSCFFGRLQKLSQSYNAERRAVQMRSVSPSTEVYMNPYYIPNNLQNNDSNSNNENNAVFPSAPPPYSDLEVDLPPKYEDIFRQLDLQLPQQQQQQQQQQQ